MTKRRHQSTTKRTTRALKPKERAGATSPAKNTRVLLEKTEREDATDEAPVVTASKDGTAPPRRAKAAAAKKTKEPSKAPVTERTPVTLLDTKKNAPTASVAPKKSAAKKSAAKKNTPARGPTILANDVAIDDDDAVETPRVLPKIDTGNVPGPPSSRSHLRDDAEASSTDVGRAILALEAELDRMIDASKTTDSSVPPPPPPPPMSSRVLAPPEESTVFDTARELLSTDFYLRKWGRIGMRGRSEHVDDFGYDPVYDEKLAPFVDFLYQRYFRVETVGIEHVPAEGRCLLVANHSGTVPIDGLMMKTALKNEHPSPRELRWLAEDFIYHFPYLGSITTRLGAVRACQENAERLLSNDALVAVFPEGTKGIGKLFRDRYRLQRFGRGGFVKLCLRTKTPMVPVAIVGGEETNPLLFRLESIAQVLGLPYVPVTPTFPLFGPAGLLPAPTKWKIVFGEPISFDEHGPEAADDDILVGRLAERVRATIQGMLDRALGERKSVFFG